MKAKITLTIQPPDYCTEKQFKEWLDYKFGQIFEISMSNPLIDEGFNDNDSVKEINIEII